MPGDHVPRRLALRGRVVTMDDRFTVLARGAVYVEDGRIVAVRPAAAPAPRGFAGVRPVDSGGTIFPGLIELHNHLSYDALPLWCVPRRFANRAEWGRLPAYRRLVSGPMQVLGAAPDLLPAVVRYVECKCLVAGVTTSQGIELFSNQGVRRFYRGLVRNVEQPADPALPAAATRIADVGTDEAAAFLARLARPRCFLLHLAEGTDAAARGHFTALRLGPRRWALDRALAGIHCLGLSAADFRVLGRQGASMVWSPCSNLLWYGATVDLARPRRAGVRLALGSDWSVSGSKNLLWELKVARLAAGPAVADRDLVAMVTREAAKILGWDAALGALAPGKRADPVVVAKRDGDPYAALLRATERDVDLVAIDGVPRYGRPALVRALGGRGHRVRVAGAPRLLDLDDAAADPLVGALALDEARDRLAAGLRDLPRRARRLAVAPRAAGDEPRWFLALDDPAGPAAARGEPLAEILAPLTLDPLTVADDHAFGARLQRQPNLPPAIRAGLAALL